MDDIENAEVSEVIIPFRDMDMHGRVRTGACIDHAEAAMEQFWRFRPVIENEPLFAPAKVECRFYQPLKLNDRIRLTVRVAKIGGKSVGFNVMFDRDNTTTGEIDFIWTATDRDTGEAVGLPEEIRDWLYQYLP